MNLLETRLLHFAHSAESALQILRASPCNNLQIRQTIILNLDKCYVETFYVGRQVAFRKDSDSLQIRRQIPQSLRAASVIPADALLFLSRLPSFQLLPTAHPVLLPTVCINRKFLETRSLHFAHSAFPISRAISSKVLCWNLEKYYVETFYAGRQVSLRMLAARLP
jgi:hypothetical protein